MRSTNILLAACLTLTSWQATPLLGQDEPAAPQAAEQRFGGGTLPLRTAAEVRTLRTLLEQKNWGGVVREFFGELYDPSLADLVVYIPASGSVTSGLVHDGKKRGYVTGQKYIWIVAFSDQDLVSAEGDAYNDSTDVRISLEALDYRRDPVLSALVKAIGTFFSGAVPSSQAQVARDSALDLRFTSIARQGASEQLYVLLGRLPVAENTTNRLSVFAGPGKRLPADHSAHFHFGNVSASLFGASLAGGLTLDAARPEFSDTTRVAREGDVRPSLYLFGHFYLMKRPHLPWDSRSLGVAIGTNVIRGGILDDIVVALSVGRWHGIGLLAGVNWLVWDKLDRTGARTIVKTGRRFRAFVGADFAL